MRALPPATPDMRTMVRGSITVINGILNGIRLDLLHYDWEIRREIPGGARIQDARVTSCRGFRSFS